MKTSASPEEFIACWQQADSVNEVAMTLNMTTSGVTSRASLYRKKGIPLKTFDRRGSEPLDWNRLAKLAESFLQKEEA